MQGINNMTTKLSKINKQQPPSKHTNKSEAAINHSKVLYNPHNANEGVYHNTIAQALRGVMQPRSVATGERVIPKPSRSL